MYYILVISGLINSNAHVTLTTEFKLYPFSTTVVWKPLCIVTCQPSIHVAFDFVSVNVSFLSDLINKPLVFTLVVLYLTPLYCPAVSQHVRDTTNSWDILTYV